MAGRSEDAALRFGWALALPVGLISSVPLDRAEALSLRVVELDAAFRAQRGWIDTVGAEQSVPPFNGVGIAEGVAPLQ